MTGPGPLPTPERLVEADGTVHVGWFAQAFEVANLADAPATHLLAGLRGTPLAAVEHRYRAWRFKQRHVTSVVTDRMLLRCAVTHAGYAAQASVYVVHRGDGTAHAWTRTVPFARGFTCARNSLTGCTQVSDPAWGTIVMDSDRVRGERTVALQLAGGSRAGGTPATPDLIAEYQIEDADVAPPPLVLVEEPEAGRWVYTHRCHGLPAGGYIDCGDVQQRVPLGGAHAGIEWDIGYCPTRTFRQSAAAAGTDADGRPIGFALAADGRAREGRSPPSSGGASPGSSSLWLNRACVRVPEVRFTFEPSRLLDPWRITDAAGLVDLSFHPDGRHEDRMTFGFLQAHACHLHGRFAGALRTPEGKRFALEAVYGSTERHTARW